MKKIFLALMATTTIAAIALTGCKDKNEPEQQQKQEEQEQVEITTKVLYFPDCLVENLVFTYKDNNGAVQTLKKDNWVAVDKNDSTDKIFLEEARVYLRESDSEAEVFGHLREVALSIKPKHPTLVKIDRVENAVLPEVGTLLIHGFAKVNAHREDLLCGSAVYNPDPDATEDQIWEVSLYNLAEKIFTE